MNDILIDHTTISKVVPLLLELDSSVAQEGYQTQAETLLKSLRIGWQAYDQTNICFKKGETLINIIDHYLRALVDTANALHDILNEDTKKQLKQYLNKEKEP